MRNDFWELRRAKLAECAYLGMTIGEAVADTGLCRQTVKTYAAKYNIKFSDRPRSRALLAASIAKCANEGLTRAQASERLGVSLNLINGIAREERIPFTHANAGQTDHDRNEAMAAMFASGKTLHEIGVVFGLTRERVRQIIKKSAGLTGPDGGQSFRTEVLRTQRRAAREAACWAKYGCSRAQLAELRRIGREAIEAGEPPAKSPAQAFFSQKCSSGSRGIEWKLTLWDWWTIWKRSGKWEQRGRERGNYVMCRFGDQGAYEVGNVYIATSSHNCAFQPNHPNRKNQYVAEAA